MTDITYTNRKGARYYLCVGKSKLGKVRYYFAREPGKPRVTAVPDGHGNRG